MSDNTAAHGTAASPSDVPAFIEAIFAVAHEPMLLLNEQGEVLASNTAFARLEGHSLPQPVHYMALPRCQRGRLNMSRQPPPRFAAVMMVIQRIAERIDTRPLGVRLARFSDAFLLLRAQSVGLPVTFVPVVMVIMNVVYALTAYPAGVLSDAGGRTRLLLFGLSLLVAPPAVPEGV